jgi:hypothetical protein
VREALQTAVMTHFAKVAEARKAAIFAALDSFHATVIVNPSHQQLACRNRNSGVMI